ncbi:MBOAT family O-acyltransferase [Flagellimonas iocasae]|uniref:MBOAT family O-acyltransferase n=1 Tax=Flagellimonas iocasae TaxID=2055905 RepID=A0ABW4XUT0_9FLAO
MLFNSYEYLIFLPLVFLCYWFVVNRNLKLQNFFIVCASYFFYGLWDWRFLSLIIFSTLVDFSIGLLLNHENRPSRRKLYLWTSIVVNLGFLGFFKYYNFFIDSFVDLFNLFGIQIQGSSLNIILPVGISFYTFQTLSYTIDVYKRNLEPTKDVMAFAAFVSFFPQLVAGPIERATNLLPQFYRPRTFDYDKAKDGLRQILWGLFKKIVIADNCATYANIIFNNSEEYSGSTLFMGAFFFAFQIYGDFSGYSDIAIGTSRLFGIDLKRNFAYPYFSRDMAEFWRRWHISLSTWFRDYLYIPLGGSKGGTRMKIRNTFAIFLVSGFWHGANWTFIVWGLLNALYFLPLMLSGKNRKNTDLVAEGRLLPSFTEIGQMLATFSLTVLAWIFFRANSVSHAMEYLSDIFTTKLFAVPEVFSIRAFAFILVLIGFEWFNRSKLHPLEVNEDAKATFDIKRWVLYFILIFSIIMFNGEQQQFIYFQF